MGMGLTWSPVRLTELGSCRAYGSVSTQPPQAAGQVWGAHCHPLASLPYSSGAVPTYMCLKTGVAVPSSS